MLNDKQVQEVILGTLEELRRTIEASSRETYTREELLRLLKQVADTMTS